MTDVRSLLRNERAQRHIKHPNAVYSATGTLECSVCHIPLKSDQEVWNKHLKSTQHAMRQERLRLNSVKSPTNVDSGETSTSKKRKADEVVDDSRKKSKPRLSVPGDSSEEVAGASTRTIKRPSRELAVNSKSLQARHVPQEPSSKPAGISSEPKSLSENAPSAPIDEDEWAAFERDVATPPPEPAKPSALNFEADISAAPLTAAEIAAQAKEQAIQQARERREAEVEGEKEDAARALEEEFDEMEGLEERVARLKRMREELRTRTARAVGSEGVENVEEEDEDERNGQNEDDEDSDDEVDMFGWGNRSRQP